MLIDIFFLLLGFGLIIVGANGLTDGSSAIAKRWGVSDLVIGLTVVSFGTSAPELVISLMSAIKGSSELAVGNVVGSNIFNVLAIIGVVAMVKPIVIEKTVLTIEIPLVVLSAAVLLDMGNGPLLDGAPERMVTRVDGIILLLFFCIFMVRTFSHAKNPQPGVDATPPGVKPMALWKAVVWTVGGLAGLVYGGDCFVRGASGIASGLGVSDAVIGLTVVAAGTSLPELATSVTAAVKGQSGIAIGNVIGSNIFNIFFVLGATATIRPLAFGSIGNFDLIYMFGACVLFWVVGWFFKDRTITRWEGALMGACYVAYIAALIAKL